MKDCLTRASAVAGAVATTLVPVTMDRGAIRGAGSPSYARDATPKMNRLIPSARLVALD